MQTLQQLEFLRLAGKSKKKKPEAPECSLTNCKAEAMDGMVVCERHKLEAGARFYAQIGLDPLFHMKHTVSTFPEWCWTYFVGSREHGIVKVGKTGCLKNRMRDLRNSSPVPIKLFAVVFGDHGIEPFLHEKFKASRKHGEWFEISGDINDCIDDIKAHRFARHIPESMIPSSQERVDRAVKEMARSLLVDPGAEAMRRLSTLAGSISKEERAVMRKVVDRLREK
jgi:hypothetical protein